MRGHSLALTVSAVVALSWGAGPPAAVARHDRARCATGGSTLARTPYMRVYRGGPYAFACLYSDGNRLPVDDGDQLRAFTVAVSGSMVAVVSFGDGSADFSVFDVRHRRRVNQYSLVPQFIAVTGRGLVAASTIAVPAPFKADPAVYADDGNGLRRVASGPGIDPASVRIVHGRTLQWTDGGVTHSKELAKM